MTKTWYIRSHSSAEVKGPFPGGQISQEILLGRHQLDDEVSHDQVEWAMIRDIPELVPEILSENRNVPDFYDRLAAARRWADERRGTEGLDELDKRHTTDSYETTEIKRLHRLANEAKMESNPIVTTLQVAIVFISVILLIVLAFQYSPKDKNTVDCSAVAKEGINWSGCNLNGVQLPEGKLMAANLMNTNLQTANLQSSDLSLANLQYAQLHLANLKYVNFTKANLKGANMMGANLSGVLLNQANLRYANFRDAIISTADFSNARLDNAIWIDGRTCGMNSVGACR